MTQGYALCVSPNPLEPVVDRPSLGRIVQKSHDRSRVRGLQRCQCDSDQEQIIQTHISPLMMGASSQGERGTRVCPSTPTNHDRYYTEKNKTHLIGEEVFRQVQSERK